MGIESIIGTRASLVLLNILLVFAAVAFLWGIIKLSYQQVTGEAMPRTKLTLGLDIFVESVNNILGAVNKAKVAAGGAPLFLPLDPGSITPPSPSKVPAPIPPRDNGQRGRATLSLLFLLVIVGVLALVGAALTGCPQLPPRSGCAEGTQRCDGDRPAVCSATGRWHQAGDTPCAAVGGVCTESAGRAFCAPRVNDDAGATPDGGEVR